MSKDVVTIASYIDKEFYAAVLCELKQQHTTAYYLGKRNPYNGKLIATEEQAELYLQQQAMSTMYRRAADMAISQVNASADKRVAQTRTETQARISDLERRISDIETKRSRSKLISILLCVAILISAYIVPKKMDERYSEGFSAGVSSVAVIPSKDTASSSSSSSTRSGTSSSSDSYSGSSNDYSSAYQFGAAVGSAESSSRSSSSSSTGSISGSATYRTTPISGYSLGMIVYVSKSGGKIHLRSSCSGMQNYYTMTYGEACEHGYSHCQKCF